ELRLLIGVVEALAHVQIRFAEVSVVRARDVCGGDVAVALQAASLHRQLRELQHPPSALEVDLAGLLERQRERNRCGAMDDRRDLAGQRATALVSQTQPGRRELATAPLRALL